MTAEKKELSQEQAMQLFQSERTKLNALQERYTKFRSSMEETFKARDSLKSIQQAISNESIMISLGAGVYATGTLSDNQNVHTTLSGGVIKTNTISATLKQLEIRRTEAEQELSNLQKQIEDTMNNVNSLSRALQSTQQPQNPDHYQKRN